MNDLRNDRRSVSSKMRSHSSRGSKRDKDLAVVLENGGMLKGFYPLNVCLSVQKYYHRCALIHAEIL